MKKETKGNLFIGLAFAVMLVLYYSSSQSYGDQSMTGLLDRWLANEPLKEFLSPIQFTYAGSEVSIHAQGYSAFVEFFIRKAAHFGSYFLLASFWLLGLKEKMTSLPLTAVLSWLLAVGYASFDEFHQSLTPDRTPLPQDIVLDSVGAATGLAICLIFIYATKKKRKKRKRK